MAEKIEVCYTTEKGGQPPLPTRLLIGLHYLKYAFQESDESVVARWIENPYWQYFCGYEFLQHDFPLHPTSLVKWRKRVGQQVEVLLQETILVSVEQRMVSAKEFEHVNVDTTVQEKNITYPTDAKLYQKAREEIVKQAKEAGVSFRQTYEKIGKKEFIKHNRYAHARQTNRAKKCLSKLEPMFKKILNKII